MPLVKARLLRLLQRLGLLRPAYRGYETLQALRAGRARAAGTDGLPVPPAGLRVMIHAMRTPEAASTRTIANSQGNALLLDSTGAACGAI